MKKTIVGIAAALLLGGTVVFAQAPGYWGQGGPGPGWGPGMGPGMMGPGWGQGMSPGMMHGYGPYGNPQYGAGEAISLDQAKEIAKQRRAPLLFAEINTGAEPQKAGVLPQDADAFLAACRETYGLTMSGLMCIPPLEEAPGPHFALTAKIAKRNGLKLLSMGMSADFAVAIALGATHVRIGSAIFGGRQ